MSEAAGLGTAKGEAARNYGDFAGVYEFKLEGEKMVLEFTKEAEGKPVRCKFIDEDFGLEVVGVRIQKD